MNSPSWSSSANVAVSNGSLVEARVAFGEMYPNMPLHGVRRRHHGNHANGILTP